MDITSPDIAGEIEEFVRRHFRVSNDDPAFSRDALLFESGYIDSLGAIELIAYIESRFGVHLEDEHIFSTEFTTINGMSEIVGSCLPVALSVAASNVIADETAQ